MNRFGVLLATFALANCSGVAAQAPMTGSMPAGASAATPGESDYAVLYRFGPPPDGNSPTTDLVLFPPTSGTLLYGTTSGGGTPSAQCSSGCGTIYSIDPVNPSGNYKQLYSFQGGVNGAIPESGLNPSGGAGEMFGTTFFGGVRGPHCYLNRRCGTVYKIDAVGSFRVVYEFKGSPDGANPSGGRHYVDAKGLFYGTTEYGGSLGFGTAYSISPGGDEKVIHSFAGAPDDGGYPVGDIASVCTPNCTFYGVTLKGGAHDDGTIFSITEDGSEHVLHSFKSTEGDEPLGGLELSTDRSTLYGAASRDGANDRGSIFSYVPASKSFTVVHSFAKGGDGVLPYARPILQGSVLFGSTQEGGQYGSGAIYEISGLPKHPQECVIHSFPDPSVPEETASAPTPSVSSRTSATVLRHDRTGATR